MAIIWPCPLDPHAYAASGRSVELPRPLCPGCRGLMTRWSGYARFVRVAGVELQLWIGRVRCRRCSVSHALLPNFTLFRRLDAATSVGTALAEMAAGAGARTAAAHAGVPHSTVRGWSCRHRARAPALTAGFAALVVTLSGVAVALSVPAEQAALEAIAAAWSQACTRIAAGIGDAWEFASTVTGGMWLGTNTTPPLAGAGGLDYMQNN